MWIFESACVLERERECVLKSECMYGRKRARHGKTGVGNPELSLTLLIVFKLVVSTS